MPTPRRTIRLIRNLLVGLGLALLAPVVLLVMIVRPRRRGRPIRSLWAGTPIPTLGVKARSEALLGVETTTLVYETTYLGAPFDHDLTEWRARPGIRAIVPFAVFLWAIWRFDRFHFFCDRGLLPLFDDRCFCTAELRFYRWLGRDVFFWTYGADVRTRERTLELGEPNACVQCPEPGRFCICDDARGAANQRALARWATAIFSMGDMTHYVPGGIDDVFFWPIDLERDDGHRYEPAYPSVAHDGPLRVVHASNHRHFKGTANLIEAVEALVGAGEPIELDLVEGVPNSEALERYRQADVIFDQCLIGFHGYFALEAMALGKPVMCYLRDPDTYLVDAASCPIINAAPHELADTLRELIRDRERLPELGRRGRAYVERYHTPARFAARLERAYRRLGIAAA